MNGLCRMALALFVACLLAGGIGTTIWATGDHETETLYAAEELVAQLTEVQDLHQAFSELTPDQRTAVTEYLRVVTIELDDTLEPAVISGMTTSTQEDCGVNHRIEKGLNALGVVLWTYESTTEWCWDGYVITNDPHFTRSADIKNHAIFWDFVGHIDDEETGVKEIGCTATIPKATSSCVL